MSAVAPGRAREGTDEPPHDRPSLSLLNAFELRCDGRAVGLPLSAQRLLAFVALHEHPLLRVYVAGTLWIDASDERAAASLRSSLWRLNRPGHDLVEATARTCASRRRSTSTFAAALALARRLIDGTADADDLDAAEATLAGELLPDWYDDWLLFERERLRQLSLHALEALAERLAARRPGRRVRSRPRSPPSAASRCARAPTASLIRVHLAEGNRSEALRQYELCRRLLRDQLGVEPSPQLDALLDC